MIEECPDQVHGNTNPENQISQVLIDIVIDIDLGVLSACNETTTEIYII